MAGKNYWETPWELVRACEARWGKFELDVCASPENAKAPRLITEALDGLSVGWDKLCWMNPPYTVGARSVIGDWVQKAINEAEKGSTTVALLVNDPSTKSFRLAQDHAAELWFLLGPRIRFEIGGKPDSTPRQTHVIAVFRRLREGERRKGGFWDWRSSERKGHRHEH